MHPNHLNEGGMKCSFLIADKYGSYFLALIIMHVKDFFISLGYHVEFAYSHICSCNWWVLYIILLDLCFHYLDRALAFLIPCVCINASFGYPCLCLQYFFLSMTAVYSR